MRLTTANVSFVDKVMFTKHLSIMIQAGVPLTDALEALIETGSSALRTVLKTVAIQVRSGSSLSEALANTKQFDGFFINLVAIGEKSGTLEATLKYLSLHLQKEYEVRKKIAGAVAYPSLVLVLALFFAFGMSMFVLPRFISFFDAFQIELPLTTRILVAVATFMRDWGIVFFSTLFGSLFGLYLAVTFTTAKKVWHWILPRIPVFGKIVLYGQLENFSRNMATMIKSGVPVLEALEITAATLSNSVLSGYVKKVSQKVEAGSSIADALVEEWHMPSSALLIRMVAVGEKSGNLEETLAYLSEFYEEELDAVAKNLTTLLEPVLLLTVGAIVGFVALAIISPIYELTGSIRRGG